MYNSFREPGDAPFSKPRLHILDLEPRMFLDLESRFLRLLGRVWRVNFVLFFWGFVVLMLTLFGTGPSVQLDQHYIDT